MANPIISQYLSDKTIAPDIRRGIAESLNSGKLSESGAIKGITAKYGTKYGSEGGAMIASGLQSLGINSGGDVAKGILGAVTAPARALNQNITNPEVLASLKAKEADMAKTQQKYEQDQAGNQFFNQAGKMATEQLGKAIPALGITNQAEQFARGVQNQVQPQEENRTSQEQLMTGVTKGIGNTLLGASELGAKGLQAVTEPITNAIRPAVQSVTEPLVSQLGAAPTNAQVNQQMTDIRQNLTTPKGIGENIGYTGEQVGEFMLPSGAIGKATKLAEGASFGQKAMNLAKLATLEGLAGTGISAAQTGDVDNQALTTGAVSAAIPVASKAFGQFVKFMGKGKQALAEQQIAQLIKPDKNAYLFGKNPAKAIIDEKIVANNWEDLAKKVGGKMDEVGSEIDNVVSSAPATKTIDATQILNKNAEEFGGKVTGKDQWRTFSDRMQQLTGEFKPDLASGELVKIADKDLSKMTAKDVWELQKKVGKLAQWTGAVGEKEANVQLQKMYGQLGKALDEMAPGTKQLQRRYAELLGADKALTNRMAVAKRNSNIMGNVLSGGAASVISPIGMATGQNNAGTRAADFALGTALSSIVRSPAARTRFAQMIAPKVGADAKVINEVLKAVTKYSTEQLAAKSNQ